MKAIDKAFIILFVMGLILMVPLGFDDIINVILGTAIAENTELPWIQAFLLTYVIGALMILVVYIMAPSRVRKKGEAIFKKVF